MNIFEFPFVIITILVMIFLVMGFVGLYFTLKSVKTAKEVSEKSFCGMGKIQSDFEKAGASHKNRSVLYISVSLDNMKRLYSESKAVRMYEHIKKILFRHFCVLTHGEISLYGKENFVVMSDLEAQELEMRIDKCFAEINEAFLKHGAVNVVRLSFGYFCTSCKPFRGW